MTKEKTETREAWDNVMALVSGHLLQMGPVTTERFLLDPKRMCFFLSRYKFAGKMLRSCTRIADIGCGDGMGTVTFLRESQASVLGVDFDVTQIKYANDVLLPTLEKVAPDFSGRLKFRTMDFTTEAANEPPFDGITSLDVIEHIAPDQCDKFLSAIRDSLTDRGIAVIGTPNNYASEWASAHSQAGHINMYTPDRLYEELQRYFTHVFLFSMNDEMVHTGFDKMAHYLMAVAVK